MDYAFAAILVVWTGFSLLRFVHMYERDSAFQRWRRWDCFRLVPVGAFFGPAPPPTEPWILVRDFLPDGRVTRWAEVPRIRPRAWWHAVWNPQKQVYKVRTAAANALLATANHVSPDGEKLPMTFLLASPYLALLRYATDLPRVARPRAVQFAVIETHIVTGLVVRSVLSAVHEAGEGGQ
jgi:hypothetical protein